MDITYIDKQDIHDLAHQGKFLSLKEVNGRKIPFLSGKADIRLIRQLLKQHPPYGVFSSKKTCHELEQRGGGSSVEKALRMILNATKITTGVAATIASGGAGGDTIVDVISVSITTSNMLKTVLDLIDTARATNKYLAEILLMDFSGGPEGVEQFMTNLWYEMYTRGDSDMATAICDELDELLTTISQAFGDWISALVPDDGGITGVVVSEALQYATANTYDTVKSIYYKLPSSSRKLFTDKGAMKQFLEDLLTEINKTLSQGASGSPVVSGPYGIMDFPNPTYFLPLAVPGLAGGMTGKVLTYVTEKFRPAIPSAIKGFNIIIPLVFASLYSKKLCVMDLSQLQAHATNESISLQGVRLETQSTQMLPKTLYLHNVNVYGAPI